MSDAFDRPSLNLEFRYAFTVAIVLIFLKGWHGSGYPHRGNCVRIVEGVGALHTEDAYNFPRWTPNS